MITFYKSLIYIKIDFKFVIKYTQQHSVPLEKNTILFYTLKKIRVSYASPFSSWSVRIIEEPLFPRKRTDIISGIAM